MDARWWYRRNRISTRVRGILGVGVGVAIGGVRGVRGGGRSDRSGGDGCGDRSGRVHEVGVHGELGRAWDGRGGGRGGGGSGRGRWWTGSQRQRQRSRGTGTGHGHGQRIHESVRGRHGRIQCMVVWTIGLRGFPEPDDVLLGQITGATSRRCSWWVLTVVVVVVGSCGGGGSRDGWLHNILHANDLCSPLATAAYTTTAWLV